MNNEYASNDHLESSIVSAIIIFRFFDLLKYPVHPWLKRFWWFLWTFLTPTTMVLILLASLIQQLIHPLTYTAFQESNVRLTINNTVEPLYYGHPYKENLYIKDIHIHLYIKDTVVGPNTYYSTSVIRKPPYNGQLLRSPQVHSVQRGSTVNLFLAELVLHG